MADIVLEASNEAVLELGAPLPPTRLRYLENTYQFESSGILLMCGAGTRGNYLIFDETIFYPKGGGQPSDFGSVRFDDGVEIKISYVEFDVPSATVRHYIAADTTQNMDTLQSNIGSVATQSIDVERRLSNAKAHTAGHVLADLVHQAAPELVGKIGFHDPTEGCYVKFQGLLTSTTPALLMETINSKLQAVLSVPAAITTVEVDPADPASAQLLPPAHTVPAGKTCRLVRIEGFAASPCGGTHVSNLSEMREINCTKVGVVKKEIITKIAYNVL